MTALTGGAGAAGAAGAACAAGAAMAQAANGGSGVLAARCAHWLLTGPAQLADGPEVGAVVGVVGGVAGEAAYAYPEITGYFLHWLGWRALRPGSDPAERPALAARAVAAQEWLRRRLANGAGLPTRIYLQPAPPDWRNDALFTFDLAMLLRGLATAGRAGLLAPDPALVAGVAGMLGRLVRPDGQFAACVPRQPGGVVPERWATQPGPFLAKAAAGVRHACAVLPGVPGWLVEAADAGFAASAAALAEDTVIPVHPLLYALEGLLAWPDPLPSGVRERVRRRLAAVLAAVDAAGRLPEALALEPIDAAGRLPEALALEPARALADGCSAAGVDRLDIVAQALRLGRLLAALDPLVPVDGAALARLQDRLERAITPDGAVPFDAARRDAGANVWATMFTEQALTFPARGLGGDQAVALARLLV